jgi:hypothetical protein
MTGLARVRALRDSADPHDIHPSARMQVGRAGRHALLLEREHLRRDIGQIAIGILPGISAAEIELIQARLEEIRILIGDNDSSRPDI